MHLPPSAPALLLCACLCASSCTLGYTINLAPGADQEALHSAAAFLAQSLTALGRTEGIRLRAKHDDSADILYSIGSAWDVALPSSCIILQRITWVPYVQAPSERTGASYSACVSGQESLMPLSELGAPFVALRVEGKSVDQEDYPLRRTVYVTLEARTKRGASKLARLEQSLRLLPKPLVEEQASLLSVIAAGDLMLERGAASLLAEGPEALFGDIAPLLEAADIAIVNLEGAVSARGERVKKSYTFRFPPESAAQLARAGIDAVLFANNHAFDWGLDAFLDTLSFLESAGIAPLGAGRDLAACVRPADRATAAGLVRLYGFASFPRERNGWDGRTAAARQTEPGMLYWDGAESQPFGPAFSDGAVDIVAFHGGREWSTSPSADIRAQAELLAAAGANLLVGSHPHVVQGFEWVGTTPVFWSLGNFVFAGMEGYAGAEDGLLVKVSYLGERVVYLDVWAVELRGPQVRLAGPEKLAAFFSRSQALTPR